MGINILRLENFRFEFFLIFFLYWLIMLYLNKLLFIESSDVALRNCRFPSDQLR